MVRLVHKNEDYIYTLSESTIHSEDFGAVKVYGISIMGENQKAEVTDISDNFRFVSNLFELIVEEELYPEHLQDVVEDFLSDCWPKIIPFKKTPESPSIA